LLRLRPLFLTTHITTHKPTPVSGGLRRPAAVSLANVSHDYLEPELSLSRAR
jgi:hypothetical protein